jgi:hypothetical protein
MENSIKVGYDSQTGLYVVKTIYNRALIVNGKPLVDALRGTSNGSDLITISEKPETITYKSSSRNLIGYDNVENMTTISLKEYNKILEKVVESKTYNEELDEDVYNTIEDEVFATRFFRTYKAIYENIEEIHNMEIEIIEYPVSAYKNIVPLHSMDAKHILETNCKFTPNNNELFFEVCASFGIDKTRIDIPTHSGLRFVKIDGSYVSGMEDFEKSASLSIISTYDKCIERMNDNRKKLEDLISFHLAKQSQKKVNDATVGNLLTQLQHLQNSVRSLDVKAKEHNSQRSILTRIGELIVTYKEQA